MITNQNFVMATGLRNYGFILLSLILILGQSCTHEDLQPELTAYQQEVVIYFNKIALGFEFGSASPITRKWAENMEIYVGGESREDLTLELQKIIGEINGLVKDGFKMEIVQDSLAANFYLYLGSGKNYSARYPGEADKVTSNFGLFSVSWDSNNNLNRGHMYVDIYRAEGDAQKHLLREELTQSLGLARDAPDYPESIFQQSWTTTTAYAPIDKELIRLLYHPLMASGLDEIAADQKLKEIFLHEG